MCKTSQIFQQINTLQFALICDTIPELYKLFGVPTAQKRDERWYQQSSIPTDLGSRRPQG